VGGNRHNVPLLASYTSLSTKQQYFEADGMALRRAVELVEAR
jgi:hypothetical protein